MAIDTQNKRRAVVELPGLAVMPIPDGTIDATDRQAAAWIYPGIPASVIQLIRTVTFLLRCTEIDYGAPGILVVRGVDEDPDIYTSLITGGFGVPEEPNQGIPLPGSTRMELLDIPILRDRDDDPGFYIGVSGFMTGWRGAVIFKSIDDGESFDEMTTILTEAVIGFADTVLASGPTTVFDETNTVTVRIVKGTLSSRTELAVLNGANAALLGNEILQFKTATLNGDGTYTLSGLLRGRRGTEWAVGAHALNERFVMLSEGGVERIAAGSSEIGLERQYKAVSLGTRLEDAHAKSFTNAAVGLEPFSPVHISGSRDGSDNLTISWIRRTRVGGEWSNLTDVPLGETAESYEIDVLNATKTAVLRTLTSTSESVVYTAADQTTDFGAPQSSINVEIFQMSATVGRGYKGEATV